MFFVPVFILTAPLQIRMAHTDIRVPDFSAYRKSATLDPAKKAEESEAARKTFAYVTAASELELKIVDLTAISGPKLIMWFIDCYYVL